MRRLHRAGRWVWHLFWALTLVWATYDIIAAHASAPSVVTPVEVFDPNPEVDEALLEAIEREEHRPHTSWPDKPGRVLV